MSETPVARFILKDYAFKEFSFRAPEDEDAPMSVKFNPTGKHYVKEQKYELNLLVECSKEGNDEQYIKVLMTSIFLFSDAGGSIPDFFYKNSIAIVFPYVRAFISTLTLQSNDGLVMLPTFNLTNLEKTLRENTEEIN